MKYGTSVLCNRANTGGVKSYEVFLSNFCPFKLPEEIQSGGGLFDKSQHSHSKHGLEVRLT